MGVRDWHRMTIHAWSRRPVRHVGKPEKLSVTFLPAWVDALPESCLRSVAEDAYYARALASHYGADTKANCTTRLRAGTKALATLENTRISKHVRCREGDKAARKFWEAKVCARGDKLDAD